MIVDSGKHTSLQHFRNDRKQSNTPVIADKVFAARFVSRSEVRILPFIRKLSRGQWFVKKKNGNGKLTRWRTQATRIEHGNLQRTKSGRRNLTPVISDDDHRAVRVTGRGFTSRGFFFVTRRKNATRNESIKKANGTTALKTRWSRL